MLLPRMENILNAMVDGVVVINKDYEINFINQVLEDEFGAHGGEKCHLYFHDRSLPCTWCSNKEVFSGKTVRTESYFAKIDKTYDLIDTSFSDVDDHLLKLTILRDNTERKKVEKRLDAQNQRISVFFKSLSDAIFVHPMEEKEFAPFVEVNDAACKCYGYSYDEFLRLSASDITEDETANSHCHRDYKKKLLETGHLVFKSVHVKKTGEKFPVEINSNIIYEGKKPFILAVVRDITERNRLEAQLRKIQHMESVATLSGGIAHEFNNALNIISGNIELLQMALPDHENVRAFGRQAEESIGRLSRLTNQLFAYARGGKYKARSIDMSEFVKVTLPMLMPKQNPVIIIKTELSKNVGNIKADTAQLEMVLSAILTNASEALDGAGQIDVQTFEKDVDDIVAGAYPGMKPGCYVVLSITDNGKGMEEETKARIFEPFFSTKFQGRGLGMAAAYGIVKNHGGYIYIDSAPGNGTTVSIFLPEEADDR